jgi:putative spermidine/putrescine transport system ATP-binding protein
MSGVSLVGVTKTYGSVKALDHVSIDVCPGELLALLGPSGCGKTTLLRSVAGLEHPDRGTIEIGGEDVTGVPTRSRPIGMVFQSYALFPNLTVRGNIAFPLEVRHRPRKEIDERVDELLDLVRLTEQADRYPKQISGGQAQRCALGRALAPNPEVLLLDEPLSALDALVRGRLRDEIRRIQQRVGITAIYVTHDQSEAMAIADRVAVMNRGRVEQIARPDELYDVPATQFAATFVGSRNAVELPVRDGRIAIPGAFDIAAPDGAVGRAIAFFRPEDVRVNERADSGNGNGSGDGHGPGMPARVELKVFLGSTTRLHLVGENGAGPISLYSDVPSRSARSIDQGSLVSVEIDPDHVQAFPL